jgi:hypothetical protein
MDARILDYMQQHKFKKVVMCNDTDSGLRAVIAIHSTALGPATGGLRMWTYANEQDAIFDAMRLARGMTYKYAAAGVDLGGGKAVIIGDPKVDKSEALMRAMGRFIDQLGGEYITGEDQPRRHAPGPRRRRRRYLAGHCAQLGAGHQGLRAEGVGRRQPSRSDRCVAGPGRVRFEGVETLGR